MLLWIVTGVLIVFTAFRSVDLIQTTLPEQYTMLAYAALAGLDGGVLAWLFWTTRAAHAGTQRTIGTLMIIVDLVGISATVIGDTMRIAGANPEIVYTASIWVVPIIIILNVAAPIICHVADPEQALRDAERAMEDELRYQKAQWIRENARELASKAAQAQGAHHVRQTIAEFLSSMSDEQPNGNGKKGKVYAADGQPAGKVKSRQP